MVDRPLALYHRSFFFAHRQKPLWNHLLSRWFSQYKKLTESGGKTSAFGQNFGRSDRVRTCGIDIPNVARYQLRHTPIVIKLWSSKWSNLWSNTVLTAFFYLPNRPKSARLKGFLRFSLLHGAKTAYAPKPPALPSET